VARSGRQDDFTPEDGSVSAACIDKKGAQARYRRAIFFPATATDFTANFISEFLFYY